MPDSRAEGGQVNTRGGTGDLRIQLPPHLVALAEGGQQAQPEAEPVAADDGQRAQPVAADGGQHVQHGAADGGQLLQVIPLRLIRIEADPVDADPLDLIPHPDWLITWLGTVPIAPPRTDAPPRPPSLLAIMDRQPEPDAEPGPLPRPPAMLPADPDPAFDFDDMD